MEKKLRNQIIFTVAMIFIIFVLNILEENHGTYNISTLDSLILIIGLLLGFYGAIGVFISLLFSNIIVNPTFNMDTLIIPLFYSLIAYIPYKLWYSLLNEKVINTPNINNVYNIKKFVLIITITSVIYFIGLEFFYDINSLLINIFWTAETYVYAITFGFIILLLNNYLNIKWITPKKHDWHLSSKIYIIIFLLQCLITVLCEILFYYYNTDLFGTLSILILLMIVFYFTMTTTSNIEIRDNKLNLKFNIDEFKIKSELTLIEKMILLTIIICYLLTIIVYIGLCFNVINLVPDYNFYESLIIYSNIIFILFYIMALFGLSKFENKITNPLENISETANAFLKEENSENIGDSIEKYKKYLDNGYEIQLLSHSLIKMTKNIKMYITNISNLTTEKEKIKTELNIAKELQKSAIPTNFDITQKNAIELYGSMNPAKEVGGDFYDFFYLNDEKYLAVIIGDVSGKGIPASLFMMKTQILIRNNLKIEKDISKAIIHTNNELSKNNQQNMFVTLWIGLLEIETGILEYINIGHPPALLKSKKEYETLTSKPYCIMGIRENIKYKTSKIKLNKDNELFVYTDGLTEAHDMENNLFSEEKLISTLNKTAAANLNTIDTINKVKNEIEIFKKETEQFDDITMLLIKIK